MTTVIVIIIVSLLFSALFSGMEIAFVTSNKLRIELAKEKGSKQGEVLSGFQKDSSRFITTLLIGNNIALIVFGIFIAKLLGADYLNIIDESTFAGLLIQTLIATVIVLLFGEFLPKTLFRLSPFKILRFFALPLKYVIYAPLKPISSFLMWLSHGIIKGILRKNYNEDIEELSSVDLEYFIKELSSSNAGEAEDDDLNAEFFEKALYLKEIKLRECMIPRTEIEGVDVNASVEELKESFIATKHSRLVIYDESLDNILGYTHHYELLKKPKNIKDILFEIPTVPETMNARDLLTQLTLEQKSIVCVVDEYGGTAGMITLEDLIEEIFGEIQDEHDEDEYIDKQLSKDEYIFSGRLEVDFLNEKYDLEIPEGEYETIAGFVVVNNEDIPETGEEITIENYRIKVLSTDGSRIETLQMKILPKEEVE